MVGGFHGERWLILIVANEGSIVSSSASTESSSEVSVSSIFSIWKRFVPTLDFFTGFALISFFGDIGCFGKGVEHSSGIHSILMPLYIRRDTIKGVGVSHRKSGEPLIARLCLSRGIHEISQSHEACKSDESEDDRALTHACSSEHCVMD